MLPDCSMEREWKVSAGAVIHRWAGNGLSWSKGASRHFSLFEPEDVLQMAILAIGE